MVGFHSLQPKQFLVLLSAVLSVVLLSSGVVTWVASNWQIISPNLKLLSIQGILLLIGALLLWLRFSSTDAAQQTSPARYWWYQGLAFLGAVISGALIALVGQIYQTGADTWQLFALWLLLIVPWFAFSPNVFIAALGAVVANTAAVLFLMNNQLLISVSTATYGLAFLNAVAFIVLERGLAKHEPLWAVLSTSILLCTIVIFVFAQLDKFVNAISLHLLIAALLLAIYNKLNQAPLRLRVIVVGTMAAAATAFLIEKIDDSWYNDPTLMLFALGTIWVVAAIVVLQLWRKDKLANKDDGVTQLRQIFPDSINLFLNLSLFIVAVFFYLAIYLSDTGEHLSLNIKNIVAIIALFSIVVALHLNKTALVSYVLIVIYLMTVFLAIENRLFQYGSMWQDNRYNDLYLSLMLLLISGLIASVLIYRQRPEAWIRFITSLGFFIFLSIFINSQPFVIYINEAMLLPIIFIALMWWSFKRFKVVHVSLLIAFSLWAYKVVGVDYYASYMNMYVGNSQEFSFTYILLAFLEPFRWLSEFRDDVNVSTFIYIFYWLSIIAFSLMPLWTLLQVVNNKGTAAKVVAVLIGLLVAWLWFARLDVIIPLCLLILAYHFKNRSFYYLAVLIGLGSLGLFYYSLHIPLIQKVYLLILSGGLFLLTSLLSAKWLLDERTNTLEAADTITPQSLTAADRIGNHVIPNRRAIFYGVLAVAVLLPIALAQWQVQSYQRVLNHGQPVLLRLLPVDPRSIMQGDYMIINYEATRLVQQELDRLIQNKSDYVDGVAPAVESTVKMSDSLKMRLVNQENLRLLVEMQLVNGVAERVLGIYDDAEVDMLEAQQGVVYLPFVVKQPEKWWYRAAPRFSTEFFFSEGAAHRFERAVFAEVVVDKNRAMLRALLDANREVISTTDVATP